MTLLLAVALVSGGGPDLDRASPADMTCAVAASGDSLLLTTGTDAGLALFAGGGTAVLSTAAGAGRNALFTSLGVCWKECFPDSQRIMLGDRVIASGHRLCGPFEAPSGILFSDPGGVHLLDGGVIASWPHPMCPSARLAGDSLWFVDGSGNLMLDLRGDVSGPHATGIADMRRGLRRIDGGGERPDPQGRIRLLRLPDGREVWTDPRTGRLTGPGLGGAAISFPVAVDPPPVPTRAPAAEIDVPWMHQRWDTPDWFNGSWSCGPSSCMMAVQYYDRITPDSIWCSSPSPGHWSRWGGYIPEVFTFLGHTYDVWGLSPGDEWVQGAHGFICRDAGGAYWSYMRDFMLQFGLYSAWAGTSWGTLTSELSSSWPVVCSSTIYYAGGTYGHIILFAGYWDDRTVIVNDPYGDANLTGWGQSWQYPAGKACLYDWPGYNNGHLEIGAVNQLFLARHEVLAPPDTLVDDLSLGWEKRGPCQFWHEGAGGFGGAHWWTWSTSSPPDTCFAKWKPLLPWPGQYQVRVYIPSANSDGICTYRLSTPTGPVEIEVDQGDYADQWAVLGTFQLAQGDSLYMGDFTGQGGHRIAFDAALFHPVASGSGGDPGAQPEVPFRVLCPSYGAISCEGVPEGSTVEVYDAAGRLVGECGGGWEAGFCPGLPPGVYFVRVAGDHSGASGRTVMLR